MNFDKLAVGPNPPHGINCHRRGAAALRSDQVPIRQDRGGDRGRPLPVHDEILPLYLGLHPDGGRALRGLPRDHAGVRQGEGLRVGPGWRRAVRARLGGVQGCTHPVELLGPLPRPRIRLSTLARQAPAVGGKRSSARASGQLPCARARRRRGAPASPALVHRAGIGAGCLEVSAARVPRPGPAP